jgi:hypothetical protein
MARPLGSTQVRLLSALREHKAWSYGCGWCWSTQLQTMRMLDVLVKRGEVEIVSRDGRDYYCPKGFPI